MLRCNAGSDSPDIYLHYRSRPSIGNIHLDDQIVIVLIKDDRAELAPDCHLIQQEIHMLIV